MNSLYDIIAILRREYNVVIEIWSIDDAMSALCDKYGWTEEEARPVAEKYWPEIQASFGDYTISYGNEVMRDLIAQLEIRDNA